jgi:hypothetical protein
MPLLVRQRSAESRPRDGDALRARGLSLGGEKLPNCRTHAPPRKNKAEWGSFGARGGPGLPGFTFFLLLCFL